VSGPFADLSDEEKDALEETAFPDWTEPMLATLTDERFSDPDWIYERKLDGLRLLAFRHGAEVRLLTRNEKRRNDAFPELVEAIGGQDAERFVVDGEVVAFEGNVSSFSRLQPRMNLQNRDEALTSDVTVYYYLFDLLYLAGHDTTRLPLRRRKALLRRAIDFADPLRWTPHRNERGEAYLQEACHKGWEGLIAKRADGPYAHGRSRDWLKFKCAHGQELVVGGWTEPRGSRIGFGALLLGTYDGDELRYAGKVGTGFDDETLERLASRLAGLERKTPPFADRDGLPEEGVHWATPRLVAEVEFTEWTSDGKLRHPRFKGLRDDKDPADVVRERPS